MSETRAQRRERNVKEAYRRGRIDQIHAEADFCDACQNHWYEDMYQLKKEVREKTIDEFYERLSAHKKDMNLSNTPWNFIELAVKEMKEKRNE